AHQVLTRTGAARRPLIACVLLVVVAVSLGLATVRRNRDYRSAVSIWQTVLDMVPDNPRGHNNLGMALKSEGQLDEAASHFRQALQLDPRHVEAHNNLGIVLGSQGKLDEAIVHFRRALQIDPDYADAHSDLGNALSSQGKVYEAISHYRQALQLKPDHAETHNNLGNALQSQGQPGEAISHYRQALQVRPDFVEAHNNLAVVLRAQGKHDEAIRHFRQALRLKPDDARAHNNLAVTLQMTGLGDVAIQHFREAARLQPNWLAPMTAAAWILATHPDPDIREPNEAVRLARRAAELTKYQDAAILDTLAAALAASGQFDRAISAAQAALALASDAQASDLASQIRTRLALYKQQKPYREPVSAHGQMRPALDGEGASGAVD
ncbi:MAG: tetratricopeptide repeat protein, partial [Phycisphaeraceae bacterium]